jgi:hypothetical protein
MMPENFGPHRPERDVVVTTPEGSGATAPLPDGLDAITTLLGQWGSDVVRLRTVLTVVHDRLEAGPLSEAERLVLLALVKAGLDTDPPDGT